MPPVIKQMRLGSDDARKLGALAEKWRCSEAAEGYRPCRGAGRRGIEEQPMPNPYISKWLNAEVRVEYLDGQHRQGVLAAYEPQEGYLVLVMESDQREVLIHLAAVRAISPVTEPTTAKTRPGFRSQIV